MRLLASGVALLTLAMLNGCANLTEDKAACQGVAIGTGALLGATTGGLIAGLGAEDVKAGGNRNWELGASTGGGALLGSLIGWGISEAVCHEPPPPPPPPPPAVRPPPPPPPPPTERRGG
jgi:hypothetical protein